MSCNQASRHRAHTHKILQEHTFAHQRSAAEKAQAKFNAGSRAVVLAAEMQSGKSGIALALAALQRLLLNDEQICDRQQLKDTLYLVTMADTALQEQAKQDLAPCKNLEVSNFSHFENTIKARFKYQPPKLIIIDECHYGSSTDSIRYERIFNYLERDNIDCRIVFISATPFSALYAAGADSILRHNFKTSLIFHKTGDEYHGIRQMHRHNQIIKLDAEQRDFCTPSLLRNRFIRQFLEYDGTGWSLIRVPSSQAKTAQQLLLDSGIQPEQIYIIGQKLTGLEEQELCSLDDFKREYETAQLFENKLIAITVAGFRAGVNFGQEMKEGLINTWDSTIANIAAVVQANIGRACGYHHNTTAKHYTNLDAVKAYSELLDNLESRDESSEFSGLQQIFEQICQRYEIQGFDRGTQVSQVEEPNVRRPKDNSHTYATQGYLVVPGKLNDPNFDYTRWTQDEELLAAIRLIRNELLGDDGPFRKTRRALRGERQNWIKAQWVNGATYDDGTPSCAKARTQHFTQRLDNGEQVLFNQIANPGGGERVDNKRVVASIFSIYNLSSQVGAFKRGMDRDDLAEICQILNTTTP